SWARGNTRYHAVGMAGVTLTILAEARGESATTVGATGSSSNPQVDLFRFNFGCGTRPSTGRAARIESRRCSGVTSRSWRGTAPLWSIGRQGVESARIALVRTFDRSNANLPSDSANVSSGGDGQHSHGAGRLVDQWTHAPSFRSLSTRSGAPFT